MILDGTWYRVSTRPNPLREARTLWIMLCTGIPDDNYLWVYVPETKALHRYPALAGDFIIDRKYDYTPLSAEEARAEIKVFDRQRSAESVREAKADPYKVPVAAVFNTPPELGPRALLIRKATDLAKATPGVWITWDTYLSRPPAKVAASELRTGKKKTVVRLAGPVAARTVRSGDKWLVQVARRKNQVAA